MKATVPLSHREFVRAAHVFCEMHPGVLDVPAVVLRCCAAVSREQVVHVERLDYGATSKTD